MKATELMIGDWIVKPSGHIRTMDRAEFSNDDAWFEDIKPIPLTPEILEKNGWWYDVEDMWLHDEVDFGIERWNGGFQCYNINQIKLDSVHQFQQALRLAGLTDMANNFKI